MASQPVINIAFGPDDGNNNGSFVLWWDKSPDRDEFPFYRSSKNLPEALLDRLFGRKADVEKIHSLALGPEDVFVLSFRPTGSSNDQSIWHLTDKYNRLERRLLHAHDHGNLAVAIGSEGDYYEKGCKEIPHCVSTDPDMMDVVEDMREDIKLVSFGKNGCGLILDKDGKLGEVGPLSSHYPFCVEDINNWMPVRAGKKAVFAALNSFQTNEHFIAFADGSYCYNARVLGGRDATTVTHRHATGITQPLHGAVMPANVDNHWPINNLINEWSSPSANTGSSDNDWLTPRKLNAPSNRATSGCKRSGAWVIFHGP